MLDLHFIVLQRYVYWLLNLLHRFANEQAAAFYNLPPTRACSSITGSTIGFQKAAPRQISGVPGSLTLGSAKRQKSFVSRNELS